MISVTSGGERLPLGQCGRAAFFVGLSIENAEFPHGGWVGSHAIGDDCLGMSVALQRLLQKRQSRYFISLFRDIALENFALMVDDAPKVMLLPIDHHKHLVEVPAPVTEPAHLRHTLATDLRGEHGAEPVPPKPHSLVANVDPALEQQVLNVPQAQRKPDVHHYHQPDDFG